MERQGREEGSRARHLVSKLINSQSSHNSHEATGVLNLKKQKVKIQGKRACTRDYLPCSSLQASRDATTSCRDAESLRGELETSAAILCRGETLLPPPSHPPPSAKAKQARSLQIKARTLHETPVEHHYIPKCNQRSTSGSGIPASAARPLSMLQTRRARAGWNSLPKGEGTGLASSPLRQQKATGRRGYCKKRLQAHQAHVRVLPVLLRLPSHAQALSPRTLPTPPFLSGFPRAPRATHHAQVT